MDSVQSKSIISAVNKLNPAYAVAVYSGGLGSSNFDSPLPVDDPIAADEDIGCKIAESFAKACALPFHLVALAAFRITIESRLHRSDLIWWVPCRRWIYWYQLSSISKTSDIDRRTAEHLQSTSKLPQGSRHEWTDGACSRKSPSPFRAAHSSIVVRTIDSWRFVR